MTNTDGDSRSRVADNANRHEEWLIDEASRDSFPASDPASSTQPGSIVNERYSTAPPQSTRMRKADA